MKKEALAVTIIGGSIAAAIALRYVLAAPIQDAEGGIGANPATATEGQDAILVGELWADIEGQQYGVPNTDITVTENGSVLGTARTRSDGSFSVTLNTSSRAAGSYGPLVVASEAKTFSG